MTDGYDKGMQCLVETNQTTISNRCFLQSQTVHCMRTHITYIYTGNMHLYVCLCVHKCQPTTHLTECDGCDIC